MAQNSYERFDKHTSCCHHRCCDSHHRSLIRSYYTLTMLISHGVTKHRFLGIHLKVKLPSFHKTFGAITVLPPDFNYDVGLTNFNQNIPNPIFDTPAQPEGCTGMTTADVCTDNDHIEYNPYFPYQWTC